MILLFYPSSFLSSLCTGGYPQVSEISCTWEPFLPQQIMEALKCQSGIFWVHQLCILILISSTVWVVWKMENMLSTIIYFNPNFNRHLRLRSQSYISSIFEGKKKEKKSRRVHWKITLDGVLDSCINRSLIHFERKKIFSFLPLAFCLLLLD